MTLSLFLYTPSLTTAQAKAIVSSGIVEDGVSLSFEVEGIEYHRNDVITVRYRVENKRKENIYLVTSKDATPGADAGKKELWLSQEKLVLNYHYFDFPELKKIGPGKSYTGIAKLPLSFLKDRFSVGGWFLYFSVGYLDSEGMSELHELRTSTQPEALAEPFQRLQETVSAGPVKLDLVE